jgi:ABC-type glycerol-3-phosphate transport system substrate-binding protein
MTRTRRAAAALVAAALALLILAGCSSKTIDVAATGATQVPGSGNLFRFCDGDTLIYFSNYGAGYADEYEFIVYNSPMCTTGGAEPTVSNLPDSDDN